MLVFVFTVLGMLGAVLIFKYCATKIGFWRTLWGFAWRLTVMYIVARI